MTAVLHRRAWGFCLAVIVVAVGLAVARLSAHDIPADVTVRAFVKADDDVLRMIVRVPLESFRDVVIPTRGEVFLDLAAADGPVQAGAELWVAQGIRFLENGVDLGRTRMAAVRVTLPSDPWFDTYDHALANVTAPALDPSIELPWTQAFVDILLEWPITSAASRFSFESEFARLGVRTRTVILYVTASGGVRVLQYMGNPGLVHLDPRWCEAARRFVVSGMEHILLGLDHLLFLVCLVVPFRQLRPLLLIVTAFTAAHSVTLVTAALGWGPQGLWFPPFIETIIAASIVWMAFENIAGVPTLGRRWVLAAVFGLAHGFGFSFALSESLQFGGAHLVTSLVAFNLGVELGQIVAVAVMVPVLALAFRHVVTERIGSILLSAVVAHQAWHWMETRWTDLRAHDLPTPSGDVLTWTLRLAIVAWLAGGVWLWRRYRH